MSKAEEADASIDQSAIQATEVQAVSETHDLADQEAVKEEPATEPIESASTPDMALKETGQAKKGSVKDKKEDAKGATTKKEAPVKQKEAAGKTKGAGKGKGLIKVKTAATAKAKEQDEATDKVAAVSKMSANTTSGSSPTEGDRPASAVVGESSQGAPLVSPSDVSSTPLAEEKTPVDATEQPTGEKNTPAADEHIPQTDSEAVEDKVMNDESISQAAPEAVPSVQEEAESLKEAESSTQSGKALTDESISQSAPEAVQSARKESESSSQSDVATSTDVEQAQSFLSRPSSAGNDVAPLQILSPMQVQSPVQSPAPSIAESTRTETTAASGPPPLPRKSSSDGPKGWKGWLRSASNSAPSFSRRNTMQTSHSVISERETGDLMARFERLREAHATLDDEISPIDWSFWGTVVASEHPREVDFIRQRIRAGIPDEVRGVVWQAISGSRDEALEELFLELDGKETEFDKQIKKDATRMNKALLKSLEA